MISIKHIIILDDREIVSSEVASIVGVRSHGDIIVRKKPLRSLYQAVKYFDEVQYTELHRDSDFEEVETLLEGFPEAAVTVIAGRAAPFDSVSFLEVLKRLRFLDKNLFDTDRAPLLAHFKSGREFLVRAKMIATTPIHLQPNEWRSEGRLDVGYPLLDVSRLEVFLKYVLQGTEARHFNQLSVDQFTYRKSSRDKNKIAAEHDYYYLLPKPMQPWFVQPFNFQDAGETASYEMVRHYKADASLQWVHDAWSASAFETLLDRLFYFFDKVRFKKDCDTSTALRLADDLFLNKVIERIAKLQSSLEGQKAIALFANSGESLGNLMVRYKLMYEKHRSRFVVSHLAIGHGDPCFSNILYDQQHQSLLFIDPRGAREESSLWSHPYYDLCKLSHSVLGNYDLINHGLFEINVSTTNQLELKVVNANLRRARQDVFIKKLESAGFDLLALRLGECSLFMSMTPLHLDQPNKALAFLLNAQRILSELEANGN